MSGNPSSFCSGSLPKPDITQPSKAKFEGVYPVYLEYGPELPPRYGLTHIRAMVRDPQCVFTYWEITPEKMIEVFVNTDRNAISQSKWVLRLYNLIQNNYSDTAIRPPTTCDHRDCNWYLAVLPDTEYAVEIGVVLPNGEFKPFARSNIIKTPRLGPADILAQYGYALGVYSSYKHRGS